MKKFVLALLLLGTSILSYGEIVTVPIPGASGLSITVGTGVNALPLQNIQNNPNSTNITTGDDSWNNVPLGFNFPYYGKTFNNSWAMTNGMVTFVDPTRSGIYGACCQGVDLSRTTDTRWNYSIFGVHSDLYSSGRNNQYYLRETDAMTYGWYNVSQCCNSQGGNNFEIKITASGTVDTRIAGALVQWNAVTSGMSGDLSKGEYYQFYHGSGINMTGASWNTTGGFTGSDPCITNPLSSPACPGYAVAYLNQQCSISALYNPSCPGYGAAYFTQQCSENPLYNSGCQGYTEAYYSQRCSADPLYDQGCPGYAAAYLIYQCNSDPLYSTQCPGYATAYFTQQCSASGLYSRDCPNYGEAYALAHIVVQSPTVAEPVQQTITSTNTTNSSAVAVIADPVVNSIVTSTTTSASPASVTSTVPLTTAPAAAVTTTSMIATMDTAPAESSKSESKKDSESSSESKKESTSETKSSSNTESKSSSSSSDTKSTSQPTAREQMVAKRKEMAMQTAVKAGADAASKLDSATSLAAQVAVQNVVIAAMGYTPGFQAYSYIMPDGNGYKPFSIYNNQKTVDNKRLSSGLTGASDRLHQQLINLQYGE